MGPEPRPRIRVLVVDDHPLTRLGVVNALQASEDFEVVGEAESNDAAVRLARSSKPDLVVLDIRLKGRAAGLDALPLLRAATPACKFVVFTNYENEAYVHAALESGASGYLLKDIAPPDLVNALRLVVAGGYAFSGQIGRAVVDLALDRRAAQPAGTRPLTPRELQVLRLLAAGKTNDEIAAEMKFSVKTVQGFLTSLYEKLDARNRTEAVVAAAKLGLVSIEPQ